MCLALPARVIECQHGDQLLIDLGGIRKLISGALTPEARPGDYVIVHVGYAIGLVDPDEAARTLALFAELEGGTNSVATPDAASDATPEAQA